MGENMLEKKTFRPREHNHFVSVKHESLAYQLFLASNTKSQNFENNEKIDWTKIIDDAVQDAYAIQFNPEKNVEMENRINQGLKYIVLLDNYIKLNTRDYESRITEDILKTVNEIKNYFCSEKNIELSQRIQVEKYTKQLKDAMQNSKENKWGEILDDFCEFYEDYCQ